MFSLDDSEKKNTLNKIMNSLVLKKKKNIHAALALFCKDNTFKVISYESQPPKSVIVCGQSVPKNVPNLEPFQSPPKTPIFCEPVYLCFSSEIRGKKGMPSKVHYNNGGNLDDIASQVC